MVTRGGHVPDGGMVVTRGGHVPGGGMVVTSGGLWCG